MFNSPSENTTKIRFSAEDDDIFNSARLLMLFKIIDDILESGGISINRIAYYDFFSAQPFLVFSEKQSSVKLDLILKGFEATTVGYISSSQRFTNRREKLKHHLSGLLMRDLIDIRNIDSQLLYSITSRGKEIAKSLKSLYSLAYQESSVIIIKKLAKLSDTKLDNDAREWLKAKTFIIDLYDF